MDILLDVVSGDAAYLNAALTKENLTQTKQVDLAQRLVLRLSTFKGEWFLDLEFGVAWFDELLGRRVSKSYFDAVIQNEIRKEPDVVEIKDYTSVFNPLTRSMSISARVKASDNSLVTINSTNFNQFSYSIA